MIIRTSPSVTYAMWLKKILDTHTSRTWDDDQGVLQEREDEQWNELWEELDQCQKQRLWGLSADLNTLRDRETWVESDWPMMSEKELAQAQRDAFQRKVWDELLEYLRRPPRFVPRPMVDYLRGRAWMEMGHPQVALLFFDNASRLEPANVNYRVLALECLKAMPDWAEILRRGDQYRHDPATPPRLLFRAADALHLYAGQCGDRQFYEEAIGTVDEGFGRLREQTQREPLSSILAGGYATKALCLKQLGRVDNALNVLDEAVRRFSDNAALLTARGLLKQELGAADAMDDFRNAVQLGTAVVWPHIELARNSLQAGRNDEAADWCRKGLSLAQRDAVAAILFELLAIALLRLNDSVEAIRAAFRTAAELDPLSEEIQINHEQFERFAANPDSAEPQWQLKFRAPPTALGEVNAQLQAAA